MSEAQVPAQPDDINTVVAQVDPAIKQYIDHCMDDLETHLRKLITDSINQITQHPTILGTLATNILHRATTALQDSIKHDPNRAARLMVVSAYIKGAARVMITENGILKLWFLKEAANYEQPTEEDWEQADASHPMLSTPVSRDGILALILADGYQEGQVRYIVTDVTLQGHQDQLLRSLTQLRSQMS